MSTKNTTAKTITLNLSALQLERLNALLLHRRSGDLNDLVASLLNSGMTQLEYHYERNKTSWQAQKATKVRAEQLEREVAELRAKLEAEQK